MREVVVTVLSARGLQRGTSPAYRVVGKLGNEVQTTSTRGGRQTVRWDEILRWELEEEEEREIFATGQTLKLILERGNGQRCGFIVLDLRRAKLSEAYSSNASTPPRAAFSGNQSSSSIAKSVSSPHWVPLAGSARGKEHIELLLSYKIRDAGFMQQPPDRARRGGGSSRRTPPPASTSAAKGVALGEMRTPPRPSTASAYLDRSPPRPPPLSPEEAGAEPRRRFRLTIELLTIRLLPKMPLEQSTVVVTAALPPQLATLVVSDGGRGGRGGGVSVSTRPAIDATRGIETPLPRGRLAVSLEAGAVHLAALLATGCKVLARVWHNDGVAPRVLLGLAVLPLAQLLGGSWIEGRAPVVAMEGGQQVDVASLRAMMALEEVEVTPPPGARTSGGAMRNEGGEEEESMSQSTTQDRKRSEGEASTSDSDDALMASIQKIRREGDGRGGKRKKRMNKKKGKGGGGGDEDGSESDAEEAIRGGKEYATAWELELWKQAEEAKFMARLKDVEAEHINKLNNEQNIKEAKRAKELRVAKEETEDLQEKLRAKLTEVEIRENKLVQAEERLAARAAALERLRTDGIADAMATARRIQEEAEHAVRVETSRATAAIKRAEGAELRVAELDAVLGENRRRMIELAPDVEEHARVKTELSLRDKALTTAAKRAAESASLAERWKGRARELEGEMARLLRAGPAGLLSGLSDDRRSLSELKQKFDKLQRNRPKEEESIVRASLTEQYEEAKREVDVSQATTKEANPKEEEETRRRTRGDPTPAEAEVEARRLISERASLLLTGAYKENDHLIQRLDSRIAQLTVCM